MFFTRLTKVWLLIAMLSGLSFAQEEAMDTTEISPEMLQELMAASSYFDSINKTFTLDSGVVEIGNGLAVLNLPKGYHFIDAPQASRLLTEIWGNPSDGGTLGMLFGPGQMPMSFSGYAVDISYEEEGYVEDDDAADIDYDELLEDMQSDTREGSKERIKQGYESVELVGWASPPYYDFQNKKLHWAQELKFGDAEDNTLNYNIRILGRKGVLVLNAIGDMDVLDDVEANVKEIVGAVDFKEGNRYSDFDPDIDKVAAVGIGGLIAGKVLAKAGFFALLVKFWKFIALGAVALFAGVRRFFGGGKKEDEYAGDDDNQDQHA